MSRDVLLADIDQFLQDLQSQPHLDRGDRTLLQSGKKLKELVGESQSTPDGIIEAILCGICSDYGFDVGEAWTVESGETMRCSKQISVGANDGALADFKSATTDLVLRKGVGLPGRVLIRHWPIHIKDIGKEANIPRQDQALRAGLSSGYAFPVNDQGKVIAVLAFWTSQKVPPPKGQEWAKFGDLLGRTLASCQPASTSQ